ncbi:MAG: RluA family pseudouridine synthase [Clostridiales Family XIII bacterium]|jgi:23S rRNA pseudouridine1911/1915/1917 synthase|nr:RluA family pseudouridine synthase [Clostridiales Family XIII bacterium]
MKYDLEYRVKAGDAGMTVRGVLRSRLGVSRRLMSKIANAPDGDALSGGVFIGGLPARFIDRVREGDGVALLYPDEASDFIPQDIAIDVLYEDDDFLALNKQAGFVVHPTKGHADGTIANGLMKRMRDRGERYKIRFANRLDMDTSGVLLVAKNAHAQNWFAAQSDAGRAKKFYLAVLDGAPAADSGVIEAPIILEADGSPRRVVRDDGALSRTFYRILERYDYGERGAAFALISISSGRTHQIRVHMAHIGCPVMGDTLYGSDAVERRSRSDEGVAERQGGCEDANPPLIARQALHAALLRFARPGGREETTVCAKPPLDLTSCLSALRSKAVQPSPMRVI